MYKYAGIYSIYKFCSFIKTTKQKLHRITGIFFLKIHIYINKVFIFVKDKSVYLLSYKCIHFVKTFLKKSYFPFVALKK